MGSGDHGTYKVGTSKLQSFGYSTQKAQGLVCPVLLVTSCFMKLAFFCKSRSQPFPLSSAHATAPLELVQTDS